MTMKECIHYVKTHKKQIALLGLTMIGSGILIACGVNAIHRTGKGSRTHLELENKMIGALADTSWKDVNLVEGFTTGKVNELWNEGGFGQAIVQYFKIKDMGALGENLKKIKGITDNTEVNAIFGFVDTTLDI